MRRFRMRTWGEDGATVSSAATRAGARIVIWGAGSAYQSLRGGLSPIDPAPCAGPRASPRCGEQGDIRTPSEAPSARRILRRRAVSRGGEAGTKRAEVWAPGD